MGVIINKKEDVFLKQLKKWILPVTIIVIIIVFNPLIESILLKTLIRPFLSTVAQSNIFRDTLLVTICIFLFLLTIYISIFRRYIVATHLILLSLGVSYYYLVNYRFNSEYHFVHFYNSKFFLSDMILLPFAYILINKIIEEIKRKKVQQNVPSISFFTDESKIVEKPTDGIIKTINILVERMKNTSPKESFAIGIVGEWGLGKTTLMKTMSSILDKDFIQVEFNPWLSDGKDNILIQFLEEFSNQLSKYHSDAHSTIRTYSKKIIEESYGDIFNSVKPLFELFATNNSLDVEVDKINKMITQIDKKIVIFIDDLDRLDNDEIVKVLMLVRNAINFNSTYFVLAYDKEYVSQAIKSINEVGHEFYLEKIVQLEVYLRRFNSANLKEDLLKKLVIELDKKKHKTAIEFITKHPDDLRVELAINHYRDINRFLNTFLMNFKDEIINEVHFGDFFNLQLIRYKYPLVHDLIYYDKEDYLINYRKSSNGFGPVQYLDYFELKTTDVEKKPETNISIKLKDNESNLMVNRNHQGKLLQLINAVFDDHYRVQYVSADETISTKYENIRIMYTHCFERYFEYSIQGNLSLVEFNNARKEKYPEFRKKFLTWGNDKKTLNELAFNIKRLKLSDFYDAEDYTNVLKILAELQSDTASRYTFREPFKELLFENVRHIDDSKIVQMFFEGKSEKYKSFILDLIIDNEEIKPKVLESIHEEVFHRVNDGSEFYGSVRNFIWDHYKSRFHEYIAKETKFSWDLYHVFFDAIKAEFKCFDGEKPPEDYKNSDFVKRLSNEMVAFITKRNDFSFFVKECPSHSGNFMFDNGVIIEIFDSHKAYIDIVANSNYEHKNDIAKLDRLIKDNPKEKNCVSIKFESLPLKSRNNMKQ